MSAGAYTLLAQRARRKTLLGEDRTFKTLADPLLFSVLYGNIGIKVLYAVVLRDIFNLPALEESKGKRFWMALGESDTQNRRTGLC